jgi:hypothetical protein
MTTLTLAGLIGSVLGIINKIIPVLLLLGIVYFMWACIRYVMVSGEQGGQRRSAIVWGLISIFVILSFWGLVRVLCNTFVPGSSCAIIHTEAPGPRGLW